MTPAPPAVVASKGNTPHPPQAPPLVEVPLAVMQARAAANCCIWTGTPHRTKPKRTYLRSCRYCSRRFPRTMKRQKYCSSRCCSRHNAALSDARRRKSRSLPPVPCRRCGKMFIRKPRQWRKTHCSRKCYMASFKNKTTTTEQSC